MELPRMSQESVETEAPSILDPGIRTVYETFHVQLKDLFLTSHLFVRRTAIKLDGKHGYCQFYDIIDSHGLRIFQGVERTPQDCRQRRGQKYFVVAILDAEGTEVLFYHGEIRKRYETYQNGRLWGGVSNVVHHDHRDIFPVDLVTKNLKGEPVENESVAESQDEDTESKDTKLFKPSVEPKAKLFKDARQTQVKIKAKIMKNSEEKEDDEDQDTDQYSTYANSIATNTESNNPAKFVLKYHEVLFIVSAKYISNIGCMCCFVPVPERLSSSERMELNIFLLDRTTKIGHLSRNWNATDSIKCETKELEGAVGVEFPLQIHLKIKAILLGAVFMMDPMLYGDST